MTNIAAIYIRVSKAEQAETYGLDAQERECLAYAARQGWTVYQVYKDTLSAKNDDRPGFQQMIAAALDGKFAIVLLHKLDRFARNRADAAIYKQLLRNQGISVLSATEQIDPTTPAGILVEGVLEVVAEWYRFNLRQEVCKGLTEKARQGGWPHVAPIGYKNVRDELKAWIEPSGLSSQITQSFQQFASGQFSLQAWTGYAWENGFRSCSGGRLHQSAWARIFRNKIYCGIVVWGEAEYAGAHTPLVDRETFDRVQTILDEHDLHDGGFSWQFSYLLRRLVWSHDAHSACKGVTAKKRFRYYMSTSKTPDGKHHYIPADDLEQQTADLLFHVVVGDGDLPVCGDSLRLAMHVTPNMGLLFSWLEQDDQETLCSIIFQRRNGIVVAGRKIETVNLNAPFLVDGSTCVCGEGGS